MTSCIGQNAILTYSFEDSAKQTVNFSTTKGIDVTVTSKGGGFETISTGGYKISWPDPNRYISVTASGSHIVRAHSTRKSRPREKWHGWADTIVFLLCNGTTGSGSIARDTQPIIDTSVQCTNIIPIEMEDTITVFSQGSAIFTATGKSSASYSIKCGDVCPDGYLKLNSRNYPGYCCIPCSEVIGGIKSITAAVRGINRG